MKNTIRPRGVSGLWRSRSPLTVLLFVAAQTGRLLGGSAGAWAMLEPPAGRSLDQQPPRASVRWLQRIDRYWDVLMFAVTPTALLVTSLPALWLREYAPFALWVVVLALLIVTVTLGLTVVLQTYRLISGRQRLVSAAAGQLQTHNWTVVLLHVTPRGADDGTVAAALVDRARRSTLQERSPILILVGGITDVRPDREGPGGLRIEPLSPRHPILVGYEPDDDPPRVPAGSGVFRGRDLGLVLGGTAVIVTVLARIVADEERRVCSATGDCSGLPADYGDALYWLISRLIGGDPDGLGAMSTGNRTIGVLITIYGVFVLVGIVGRVVQQRIDEDSRTGAEVVAEFEERRSRAATAGLFPEIEPYDRGMLDVGEGHRVYWEVCGNPDGKPAVVLHGGPGSGCTPEWRRYFDPAAYQIVLFDQRGCGRSTPNASDPAVDLTTNKTPHLVADIERLREHLGIKRWLVFGGSWGSTLGLAYTERHPKSVSEIILFSVVGTSRREVKWVTGDMRRFFPAQWERFRAGVPAADGDLVEAYSRLLNDPNRTVREKAARDWCDWEDTHVTLRSEHPTNPRYDDPSFRMCFARLVTHYWQHTAWLAEDELLTGAHTLNSNKIPGVLIHGRLDVSGPPDLAWDLSQVWQDCKLVLIDDAGHGASDGSMVAALVEATEQFATRT